MATEVAATSGLVDTRLVVKEVGSDGEGDGEGAVGDELLHHVGLAANRVSAVEEELVLAVGNRVGRLSITSTLALGSGVVVVGTRGEVSAVDVVSAGNHGVGDAVGVVAVERASDNTLRSEEVPSSNGVTTVATVTAASAAGQKITGRESRSDLALGSNAVAILGTSSRGDSPTRATSRLVPDFGDA